MHHARTHSVGKSQSGGNPERAFELFQAAAEKGFYPAWNALASMHLDVRTRILASLSRYLFVLAVVFRLVCFLFSGGGEAGKGYTQFTTMLLARIWFGLDYYDDTGRGHAELHGIGGGGGGLLEESRRRWRRPGPAQYVRLALSLPCTLSHARTHSVCKYQSCML